MLTTEAQRLSLWLGSQGCMVQEKGLTDEQSSLISRQWACNTVLVEQVRDAVVGAESSWVCRWVQGLQRQELS